MQSKPSSKLYLHCTITFLWLKGNRVLNDNKIVACQAFTYYFVVNVLFFINGCGNVEYLYSSNIIVLPIEIDCHVWMLHICTLIDYVKSAIIQTNLLK